MGVPGKEYGGGMVGAVGVAWLMLLVGADKKTHRPARAAHGLREVWGGKGVHWSMRSCTL